MPVGVSAYVPLATKTLTVGTAQEVNFTSISQAYRDLICVINVLSSAGTGGVTSNQINADAGSNYSLVYMSGSGSAASSSTATGTTYNAGIDISTTSPANGIFQFMDYSATDKHKTILIRSNQTASDAGFTMGARAVRWASTAAITQFRIRANTTFAIGSTFTLYGVSA